MTVNAATSAWWFATHLECGKGAELRAGSPTALMTDP